MSTEQTTSEPTSSSSASVYPSTSLPPSIQDEPMLNTNNGSQVENGTYPSMSDSNNAIAVNPPTTYYSKVPTSNGQYSTHSNHISSSPGEQSTGFLDPTNSTPSQQLTNNDHVSDSGLTLLSSNQNDTFPHSIDQQPSTETTPPNAYKAQITTTSLKPKESNGGDKTTTVAIDHVEPSTSVQATATKATPKASQARNRTPARSRKAANASGEPRPPRSNNQNTNNTANNASAQGAQTPGTKRPHPNQYTYQPPQSKESRPTQYPRYSSNVPVPVSTQMHHGGQQVQYSIPASSYNSPKIYVQSQGLSSVPSSATYNMHPRAGTSSLAQRSSVSASASGQPQVIIQCRPDQQPYPHSQGQASNQHFIIQTQQASDQPPTVYQQRPGVSGRPEIQRQYIQTIQNGPPPPQSSVSNAQGQQASGQPQVLHIQLHHSGLSDQQKVQILQPTSAVQQQLMEKRLNQIPNGPQQQLIGTDQQLLSDRQGPPSSTSTIVHQHHLPSTTQQQLQRAKNVRTLAAQPQIAIKQDDLFDDLSMHPAHLPLPDSFSTILDQIHSSGESPKAFYRRLKKQFKYLVYENECYQEELRNSQRHLLKLSRDKNFLLDRLLNYESAEPTDESDADSDATIEEKIKPKKKKVQQPPRKRNTASTSKKVSNKSMPKPEDENENSQGSLDSGMANSQGTDSFQFASVATASSSHDK